MVTLRHPTCEKVTVEVDPADLTKWVAAGWIDKRGHEIVALEECCGEEPDAPCEGCPAATPEPDPVPAPKPAPRRRKKNPSIGDD